MFRRRSETPDYVLTTVRTEEVLRCALGIDPFQEEVMMETRERTGSRLPRSAQCHGFCSCHHGRVLAGITISERAS